MDFKTEEFYSLLISELEMKMLSALDKADKEKYEQLKSLYNMFYKLTPIQKQFLYQFSIELAKHLIKHL